jgi:hypothetical protein
LGLSYENKKFAEGDSLLFRPFPALNRQCAEIAAHFPLIAARGAMQGRSVLDRRLEPYSPTPLMLRCDSPSAPAFAHSRGRWRENITLLKGLTPELTQPAGSAGARSLGQLCRGREHIMSITLRFTHNLAKDRPSRHFYKQLKTLYK